jgi:hypothetical protein
LSYQWYYNTNTPLPNATNAALSFSSVQFSNAGSYSVAVTNNYGAVTSAVATLTVNAATCAPPAAGLVNWWRGEGDVSDTVGTNNGTLGGAGYTTGMVGQAFNFNGSGSYASFGNAGNFGTNDFTLEFWIRTTSTDYLDQIMQKRSVCGASSAWVTRRALAGSTLRFPTRPMVMPIHCSARGRSMMGFFIMSLW